MKSSRGDCPAGAGAVVVSPAADFDARFGADLVTSFVAAGLAVRSFDLLGLVLLAVRAGGGADFAPDFLAVFTMRSRPAPRARSVEPRMRNSSQKVARIVGLRRFEDPFGRSLFHDPSGAHRDCAFWCSRTAARISRVSRPCFFA
jgi:hypothetical protein